MAHTVTITKLLEGPRHFVSRLVILGDSGTASELTDQTWLNPAVDFAADQHTKVQPVKMTVIELWHDGSGAVTLKLEYDATTKQNAWILSDNSDSHTDFSSFGGIQDTTTTGSTGKLLFSTEGLTSTSHWLTAIVRVKKERDV